MYGYLLKHDIATSGSEPVLVADVAKQLELPSDHDHEPYLSELLSEARKTVENASGYTMLDGTVTAYYAPARAFKLYRPPFGSLTSVSTFYEGEETQEDEDKFFIENRLVPVLRLKRNETYTASCIDEVKIVYTVTAKSDEAMNRAVIQLAAERFQFRFSRELGTVASGELESGAWKRTLENAGLVIPRV